mmetsp:Transcript_3283/g.7684  ORF Transcript_3283/g.7684 Transcript_3283/m.7684 type:complete len:204 (-) Transcript_3283:244-855(-)|eukprot:CAMPEP_0181432494 /NCGR_PEP_ID=MMETSP1110-20121109/18799_1 /TAXON_ID=174948 /ORGANISM="Symbiodinium sp., Strain CCMP421" /LENGTH=203 /DNA_ID=CAMNT_0023555905 /DNA_START=75 /DNA_END=686 /DNA_ORIENTATION=+
MSISGDDDERPVCKCGLTMNLEDGKEKWNCSICEELKAACALKYACTCGRRACDECAWSQLIEADADDDAEEECEDYGEWNEYCEVGAYNDWNGASEWHHPEDPSCQSKWEEPHAGEWEEWEEYGTWNEYCEVGACDDWNGASDYPDHAEAGAGDEQWWHEGEASESLPALLTATQEIKALLKMNQGKESHASDANAMDAGET